MCQFASFLYRPDTGDIAVWDLASHSNTQEHLKLTEPLWCEGHYLPSGKIQCRVTDKNRYNSEECALRLRKRFPTFYDFLNYAFKQEIGGSLDLRGCDLSKITTWPKTIGGSLDLRDCDLSKIKTWPKTIGGSVDLCGYDLGKVKTWPKTIGGSLDLSDCDLSKIKTWPKTIGGWLGLSGCDLSKITTWPKTIGGSLDLRDCDLGKVKIPKRFRIIK